MRVLSIYRPTKFQPPTPKLYEDMGKFMAEAVAAGVLLATEGIGPSTPHDVRVRYVDGDFTVTDGPFTEAKEAIGGFAIMQFKSRAEMLDWTRRFLAICGDGECEIHPLSDVSPMDQFKR